MAPPPVAPGAPGSAAATRVSVWDNFSARGVWILGIDGLRPAPKPDQFPSALGQALLSDGDKVHPPSSLAFWDTALGGHSFADF